MTPAPLLPPMTNTRLPGKRERELGHGLEIEGTNMGGVFPKIGGCKKPKNGWFILFHGKAYEQMDDLGIPVFLETPIWMKHDETP